MATKSGNGADKTARPLIDVHLAATAVLRERIAAQQSQPETPAPPIVDTPTPAVTLDSDSLLVLTGANTSRVCAKTIYLNRSPTPAVKLPLEFTWSTITATTLEEMYPELLRLRDDPRSCLVHGAPTEHWPEGAVKPRRSKARGAQPATLTGERLVSWAMFDFDGAVVPERVGFAEDCTVVIRRVLGDVGFIAMKTPKYRADGETLRFRAVVRLAEPVALTWVSAAMTALKAHEQCIDASVASPVQPNFVARPLVYFLPNGDGPFPWREAEGDSDIVLVEGPGFHVPEPVRVPNRSPAEIGAMLDESDWPEEFKRVLQRFEEEGMLIEHRADGRGYDVLCPWEDAHTSGAGTTSASTLFFPDSENAVGGYSCLHEHCNTDAPESGCVTRTMSHVLEWAQPGFNSFPARAEALKAYAAGLTPGEAREHIVEPVVEGADVDIFTLPGALADAYDYILSIAPYPQREYALAGAIAACSLAIGPRLVLEGHVFANTYTVIVGASGSGKDAGLKGAQALVSSVPSLSEFWRNDAGSGAGIEDHLAGCGSEPRVLMLIDEIGKRLQEHRAGKQTDHGVMRALMALYTAAGSTYKRRMLARSNAAPAALPDIKNPYVCLLGASTPRALRDAMTGADAENGWLGRIEIVNGPELRPENRTPCPDTEALDRWKTWAIRVSERGSAHGIFASAVRASGGPGEIVPDVDQEMLERLQDARRLTFDAAGREAHQSAVARVDAKIRELGDREENCAWLRVNERASKYALIHAVTSDRDTGTVTDTDFNWGSALACTGAVEVERTLVPSLAKNEYERDVKDVLKTMQKVREYNYNREQFWLQRGLMPGSLLRRRHRGIEKLNMILARQVENGTLVRCSVCKDRAKKGLEVFLLSDDAAALDAVAAFGV